MRMRIEILMKKWLMVSQLGLALLTIVMAFVLLPAAVAIAQVPVVRADFANVDTEIPITQWQLLGPFRFDKKDLDAPDAEQKPVGLSRDYLQDFDLNESSVNATTFAMAKTPKPGIVLDKQFVNALIATRPKTNILELAVHQRQFDYAVAYVSALIESPRDQEIVIAAGADDNIRVWLNHELLFADFNTKGHSLTKFQRLIGAKLKQGNNLLVVKVGNLTGDWRLFFTLFRRERALTLARENAVNPILVSSIVPVGTPLQVRTDLLASSADNQLEIVDSQHIPLETRKISLYRNFNWDLEKLKENRLYYCRMLTPQGGIEKAFYYGDLEAAYGELSRAVEARRKMDESIMIDLQAQLARLKHLLLPESRKSEFWDQKVVASVAEIEESLSLVSQSADAFRHAAGTHIRGYRSAVDGQIQHYWLHVPQNALKSGKPIPLVIALPYITGQNLPFLESYFLAAFDETERYRILGDQYGYAVLQLWGRGNFMGGTAVGTRDVFEALDAVRKDYPMDPDRIYLVGYCEGGESHYCLVKDIRIVSPRFLWKHLSLFCIAMQDPATCGLNMEAQLVRQVVLSTHLCS